MYRVRDTVRATRNRDGGVVLDIHSGKMFRLNPVGALILESVVEGRSEGETAFSVAHQYDIGEETALADVRDFLQSLEKLQLVTAHDRTDRL